MHKSVLTLSVVAALAAPTLAAAADPSPLTGNMSIVTDYRFRGISQTFERRPSRAASTTRTQAASTSATGTRASARTCFAGSAGIEMDFYGGWKKSFGDIGFDVGTAVVLLPAAPN